LEVSALLEVAIDRRDYHVAAEWWLLALVTCFDLTIFRAAVTRYLVGVVALLAHAREHETVATLRLARSTRAVGFERAERCATVAEVIVLVVAALRALDFTISAFCFVATVIAWIARACPTFLPGTDARTTISILIVAVVASLVQKEDSVSALANAQCSRERTIVARCALAVFTTVALIVIGVVTRLCARDAPVAAAVQVNARLTGGCTLEA